MKIKDYECKCGHNEFFFADKGNQKGIYCSYCGKWFKWADKNEQNLALKQESTLDKIRAEIEEQVETYIKEGCYADNLIAYGFKLALEIIDKYKEEREDKE